MRRLIVTLALLGILTASTTGIALAEGNPLCQSGCIPGVTGFCLVGLPSEVTSGCICDSN